MHWTETLFEELVTPGKLVGHLSYILLVTSMLMRSMSWLRVIAIASGLVAIVYGYIWLDDWVVVVWETIFVSVNVIQMMILMWENRNIKLSGDEAQFIRAALPDADRGQARKVLRIGAWEEFHADTELIREGEPVDRLLFILGGTVRIDRHGQMVGVCGHDDFLGEIAFMLNTDATATAVVTNSVRCISFEREPLAKLLAKDTEIRHAIESSFNRNLVDKLIKSNEDHNIGGVVPLKE